MEDQARFAAISHDLNPMHVDPVLARRLLTGAPVVHGIHILMLALEHWNRDGEFDLGALDCTFNAAVNVGDEAVFEQREAHGQVFIEARVDDVCCMRIRLTAAERQAPTLLSVPAAGAPWERRDAPLDLAPEEHIGKRYVLGLPPTATLPEEFKGTCALLGTDQASGLLALSYFVGMVCPGLHSVFARLSLQMANAPSDRRAVALSVDSFDPRFGQFQVSIAGALSGSLTAFIRPPPQRQPTMAEIARAVASEEFKETRSLVIGGSRGLGELVAKALAAGGGDVVVSFARGRDDAARVAAEIDAWGAGTCELAQLDVTAGDFTGIDFDCLSAIYYFATPRIYRKKACTYVDALFREFVEYYVKGLDALCQYIEALPLERPLRVYVPSSVFVADRPDGLTEYAMAKAAAEVLVADLQRNCKRVRLFATRLPPLRTDQTASLLGLTGDTNLATVLPLLRAINDTSAP